MKNNGLTLKVFLLIVLNDIGDTIAQLIMKKGLIVTGIDNVTVANLFEFSSRSAQSPLVWMGLVVYIFNFFLWIAILSRVDLSIAMPVGSTSYIFVPLAAMVFLHENVSLIRWVGILLIVAGIHYVSRSGKSAEAVS